MKRTLLSVFLVLAAGVAMAEERTNVGGIPENYGGVMLQGFYWDSYDDTKWTNLTSQADELAEFFDLIWIPQSGYCGEGNQMGYMDLYWFENYNSSFGTEEELKTMISTFKEKGLGTIADVVINHRNTLTGWWDFPEETWNGITYKMGIGDVCSNDERYSSPTALQQAINDGYSEEDMGAAEDYDEFSGARDLDHSGDNVQYVVKAYLKFLLEELGYTGFRYDMVKGYGGEYVGIYNADSNPAFSVGEYWDSKSSIENWINTTKNGEVIQSGAFDFPLKYVLNSCCNAGSNWNELGNSGGLIDDKDYRRYAVTFVDNHDTEYRGANSSDANDDTNQCYNNVLAANAFILAAPGTPCIYLSHWKNSTYKKEIKQMIYARKLAGVHNQSDWNCGWWASNTRSDIATGTNGNIVVVMGDQSNSGATTVTEVDIQNDYFCVSSGTNYSYYISKSVNSAWASVPSGTYDQAFEVTLNALTTDSSAKIVYTTDGSNPTASSEQLDDGGKVTIDVGETTLKAAVLVGGEVKGQIERTYNVTGFSPHTITIYVQKPENWGAMYFHSWDNTETDLDGGWPGDLITTTTTIDDTEWYYHTYVLYSSDASINLVFTESEYGPQTVNITNITEDKFYTISTSQDSSGNYYVTDVSGEHEADIPDEETDGELCLKSGEQSVFFDNSNSGWETPIYAWIWNGDDNYTGGTWPGEECTYIGNGIWKWTYSGEDTVVGYVIFDNGEKEDEDDTTHKQTSEMLYVNGGVYSYQDGYMYTVPVETDDDADYDGDATSYFSNLGFETGSTDPWNVPLYTSINSEYSATIASTTPADSAPGDAGGNYYFLLNGGIGSFAGNTLISQQSNEEMPAGKYTVSARICAGSDCHSGQLALYAKAVDDSSNISKLEVHSYNYGAADVIYLPFELETEGKIEIGIMATDSFESTNYLWLYADDFNVTDKEVSITVTPANYATYYTNHSYVMPEGLIGAITESYTENDDKNGGTLTFNWKYDGDYSGSNTVPGHTALLIKTASDITETIVYHGHIISEDGTADSSNDDNLLHGSTVETTTNVDDNTSDYYFYKFSYDSNGENLGFYWDQEEGAAFTIDAHKAWLAIPKTANVKLAGLVIGEFDPTGIKTITAESNAKTDAIYTLQGIRVNDMSKKGIYIVGGKKVVK